MEFWGNSYSFVLLDPDAAAYIAAVQAADGQALEAAVASAINAFIVGCKTDGIWAAIKACCILAGARTLTGALVPLRGAAPTNFNFETEDYNRKTGLVGDGSKKYLDSNRAANADPQNSCHLSGYVSTTGSGVILGSGAENLIAFGLATNNPVRVRGGSTSTQRATVNATGFMAANRNVASSYVSRLNGSNETITIVSGAAPSNNFWIYNRSLASSSYSNARLAFYSIGESLDLALLDARVTALINALAAAIP